MFMALKGRQKSVEKYPVYELDIFPVESSTDIHPHTDYTDGMLSLVESADEAHKYGLWEKGVIEHGNPLDPDINHPTTFLKDSDEFEDEEYTSEESYVRKFENLRDIADDIPGAETLTDAEPEKLVQDIEIIRLLEEKEADQHEFALNYSMIFPHGVELDYNPATETTSNQYEHSEAVNTYENSLIDFLKDAESKNTGYNYVLLSSHYVNTPFKPRYVKKDKLFQEMDYEEKGEILEHYRDKEITKIESLSGKLSEMSVPEASDELMSPSEREELQQFIYDQSEIVENISGEEIGSEQFNEATQPSLEISRPGPVAVGAHPTIIERNVELMDYFRKQEGITTKAEIHRDINQRMSEDIEKQDVDHFLGEKAQKQLYPSKTLEEYYEPMVEAAEQEENFIFEINGKGVERQHPSVFWEMLDENLFGTDSHRLGEQPSRTEEFKDHELESKTTFLTEKWLDQLRKHSSRDFSSVKLDRFFINEPRNYRL